MVKFRIKGNDKLDEFIYQCNVADQLDQISKDIINVNNVRMVIRILTSCVQELIKYGPMRPLQERGLSHKILNETIPNFKTINGDLDPSGSRIGQPILSREIVETLNNTINDALIYIDTNHPLELQKLLEQFQLIKASIIIAYPMGLPDSDIISQVIYETSLYTQSFCEDDYKNNEEKCDDKTMQTLQLTLQQCFHKKLYDPLSAQLWFANKKLLRHDKLEKYIGKNEKCTIVVKITSNNDHMPVREAVVDEETRRKMMAFWYKKQEQDKNLKEDDDNSYLQQQWANPHSLKDTFAHVGDIKLR